MTPTIMIGVRDFYFFICLLDREQFILDSGFCLTNTYLLEVMATASAASHMPPRATNKICYTLIALIVPIVGPTSSSTGHSASSFIYVGVQTGME